MENSKKFAKEALNGPASSRQRLHHQEGTTNGAPIASGDSTNSVQPLGSSSLTTMICLPPLIGMARVSLSVYPS